MTTQPTARAHLVAVVDNVDGDTTLPVARNAVRAGARATVFVSLGRKDRENIREFATAEHISSDEAESRYLGAFDAQIHRELGADAVVHVTGEAGISASAVAEIAGDATEVAIPSTLARRRNWRRAMARTGVPVTVTPSAA